MINSFDSSLYHLINQKWTNDTLDFIMLNASDKFFWIPFYAIVVWMMFRTFGKKLWLILLFLGLSLVASDRITSGLMKPYFKRLRPCHEQVLTPRIIEGVHCSDTGSMASSHAANHFAIAIFMILLYGTTRKTNVLFWISWALLVCYSRVYLGVHYPTDVIVGALVGSLAAYLMFKLYSFTLSKLKSNQ